MPRSTLKDKGRLDPVRFAFTDHDGIDLLKWMNEKGIDIPLIIMTGYADIQSAVQAMKLGARDYVAKPVNPEELLKKCRKLCKRKKPQPFITLPKPLQKKYFCRILNNAETHHAYLEGESDAAKQLYNYVGLVAPTNMSVLINGSSGTGEKSMWHTVSIN